MRSLMPEGTIPGRERHSLRKVSGAHNLESKGSEGTEYKGKGEKRHVLSSQKHGTLDKVHRSLLILFEKQLRL